MLPDGPGLYLLMIGRRWYIGMTKHLRTRRQQHFYHLRRGDHFNPILQRAFDRHGVASFHILHETKTPKTAAVLESCYLAGWIDDPLCMNVAIPDGNGASEMTDEHKQKIADACSKRIVMLSPKGQKIIFDSINQVAEFFGVNRVWVAQIFRKEINWPKTSGHTPLAGWKGKVYGTDEWLEYRRIPSHLSRPCVIYTKDGSEFHFASASSAAAYFGDHDKSLSKRLNGKIPWPAKQKRAPMLGCTGRYYDQTLDAC